ncbi:N-acetylmannosamine-6-phosphate 2-epimerase [Gloeobacter kilaueensis]|uniref:N-acylglucosamine-6-phosphate 2-epimerase n=1 Tax=Gloeobacter kilaueensis (strain ATCC BAA-2537 / CCAP 1431/1 / ULC 316 / JS1) TaxID=1183438 RepID=U5QKS1_GLOK1|nr:N-acetylmannosamine-6-phosphate 2-epimerase [Gloeobacter kilaueensis]AGY59458.1 N-acetylmannosamine-6-phosphate 2-epimerase [Gloeobacter kilaueensis JS1]
MSELALLEGLIVSCQAPATSPLHAPPVIAAMAEAACLGGAVGVRIESPAHIQAVRGRVNRPIVGLWKRTYPDSAVYITPTFADAQAVALSGADIVAIDATDRERPNGEQLGDLIARIWTELQKPVLADVATRAEGIAAARLGADIVATTLCGYTEMTHGTPLPALDLVAALAPDLSVPVWCEGGVKSPAQVALARSCGARVVVVGTALTGLDVRVREFAHFAGRVSPTMQTEA